MNECRAPGAVCGFERVNPVSPGGDRGGSPSDSYQYVYPVSDPTNPDELMENRREMLANDRWEKIPCLDMQVRAREAMEDATPERSATYREDDIEATLQAADADSEEIVKEIDSGQ